MLRNETYICVLNSIASVFFTYSRIKVALKYLVQVIVNLIELSMWFWNFRCREMYHHLCQRVKYPSGPRYHTKVEWIIRLAYAISCMCYLNYASDVSGALTALRCLISESNDVLCRSTYIKSFVTKFDLPNINLIIICVTTLASLCASQIHIYFFLQISM